jgi:hypothetical protein
MTGITYSTDLPILKPIKRKKIATDLRPSAQRSFCTNASSILDTRRTEHLQSIALHETNIPYDTSCTMDHETSAKQRPALSTYLQPVDTLEQLCLQEMTEEEKEKVQRSYVFNEYRLVTEPGRLSLFADFFLREDGTYD